jgi:hypothetical protein
MDGLSWDDLDASEQHAMAMLADGGATDLCDPEVLLTLTRIGLISASRLTASGEQMMSAAIWRAIAV